MRLRLILTLCLALPCAPVAQAQPRAKDSPAANVNDCTLVRDPTVLRDCLDLAEGQRLGPAIDRSPPDPIVSPQLLKQAKPDPRSPRGEIGAPARNPALRTVGFDPVRVEQIRPRRRNGRYQ
ncbi:MAG: hypothetical protein INR70_17045 [Parafilimonas terrae]|nr:hypothetical protein [Parafilimonas terrae]